MPSQEAGSNPAPGSSSGSADRQAQDAQRARATSPPRTEQELAQVRKSSQVKVKVTPQAKAAPSNPRTRLFSITTCSHLPKLGAFDDSDPPFVGPPSTSPLGPEVCCILHPCPACSSSRTAVAPLNGSQKSGLNGSHSPGRPGLTHRVPAYIMCYAMYNLQPLANKQSRPSGISPGKKDASISSVRILHDQHAVNRLGLPVASSEPSRFDGAR